MAQHKWSPIEELGLAISQSSDPMGIYDQETLAFLNVNDPVVIGYGYSCQELLRMTFLDIRPPEDIPGVIRSTLHPKEKSTVTCALYRHRDESGHIFKVEITC